MDTPFLLLFNRDNDDKLGGFRNTLDSDTSIVAQHKLFFNEARTGDWSLRRSNAPLGVSICTSPQRKYSTLGPKWLRVKTLVPWFSKQLVVMVFIPVHPPPKFSNLLWTADDISCLKLPFHDIQIYSACSGWGQWSVNASGQACQNTMQRWDHRCSLRHHRRAWLLYSASNSNTKGMDLLSRRTCKNHVLSKQLLENRPQPQY